MRDTFAILRLANFLCLFQFHLLACLNSSFYYIICLLHSKGFSFARGTFEGHFFSPGAMGLPARHLMSPAILPCPFNCVSSLLDFKAIPFVKRTFERHEGHLRDTFSPGAMGLPAFHLVLHATLPCLVNYVIFLLHFKVFLFVKGTYISGA